MGDKSTLLLGEPHPCSYSALEYIKKLTYSELMVLQSSFASCAIEGNRVAEVCLGTLDRLMKQQSVRDRYLFGLAWYLVESRRLNNEK